MTENEKVSALNAIDSSTRTSLGNLFRDQSALLLCLTSVFYLPSNHFVCTDGSSFRFRKHPKATDTIACSGQIGLESVKQPTLLAGSTTCIKATCVDQRYGTFSQAWVPLRRKNSLLTEREDALYGGYADCFKRYVKEVYSVDTSKLPDNFFNTFYNVDHLAPSGWLLRPLVRRGCSPDPKLRTNDPTNIEDATERGEIAEYVSLMLVPSKVNQAWGRFEGGMKRDVSRFGSLGGAQLTSIAKVLGIMPRPSDTEEAIWLPRLILTIFDYGILDEEEIRALLADEELQQFGSEQDWKHVPRLDVSPLVKFWGILREAKIPSTLRSKMADQEPSSRNAQCFVSGTYYRVYFNDPDLPSGLLAQGEDIEVVKRTALTQANAILGGLGLRLVNSLRYHTDEELLKSSS